VSALYGLRSGWANSYPETTGYIISSFIAYAKVAGLPDAKDRALRMADWEIVVQMPSGAVQSGAIGIEVRPAVFNTGQVILGWVSAYKETRDPRYADAIRRAAAWLLEVQDVDGAWRKELSLLTATKVQVYNTRTAWALAKAGLMLSHPEWIEAARRNAEWAITQQDSSGWFANNTFEPGEAPLTHTICYAIEGLLGLGELLDDAAYVKAARLSVQGLCDQVSRDGKIAGRYGSGWRPMARWRCLTGDAQLAGILLRLQSRGNGIEGGESLARDLIDGVCATQDMNPRHVMTFGGVAGSWPIWGGYLTDSFPNWAAKFHLDSLLLCLHECDPHPAGESL